ncbi:hypothetical protein EJ04DRAFT_21910 [Polyplosphaeria fusca]|uniref:Uncharacterized protein n=1 Tax=Polyplosphaeria fusca TaxID=682080 RepID=A0A9P4QU69_9PLEO|nr:hypothetical protein EJ04DRAFT_21910 [Polyplosphaeria fusca]
MRFAETAAALLGLNAFLGTALQIHPRQEPGVYVGSSDDADGLNHTRIGDVKAASRMLRGLSTSSIEKRLPGVGTHDFCWEGGALESSIVTNLRSKLGQLCDTNDASNWVNPKSTVYATDGTIAAFFCNYGKQASYCTQNGVLDGGNTLDGVCGGTPGRFRMPDVSAEANWF